MSRDGRDSAVLCSGSSNSPVPSNRIKFARIKKLHRLNAFLLLAFLLPHLGAHLFAIAGPQAHEAALDAVRWTYRPFPFEILLVTILLSQICLGLLLARARLRIGTNGRWGQLQIASGGYLALFAILHGSAALVSRYINDLPTNFDWVATPLQHPVTKWLFYPYYALAVLALMTHLSAWLAFRGNRTVACLLPIGGAMTVTIYLASFGGWLFPVEAPEAYLSIYDDILGSSVR